MRRIRWAAGILGVCAALGLVVTDPARAATVNADGTVSVKVNFRYPPQPDDVTRLERELQRTQRILCDATDGQLKLNNALVTVGDSGQEGADIWLLPNDARSFAGWQINLYRGHVVGDVIAHEFGHSILDLGEQYEEQSRFGTACDIGPGFDASVRLDEGWNSIMQQAGGYYCVDSVSQQLVGDYNPEWFNFPCSTDADCAAVCTAAGCPTDAAGNLVDFVCPSVPPRNSELSRAAGDHFRRARGVRGSAQELQRDYPRACASSAPR